ncbi:YihY/virulence factor BrkB family protein [Sphingomonas sp. LaA6.9]|uniref:YihY/virulence factor BrkB family protein n=1 Tax=Sphingomonas sp. LaA6.9 TaxID=2919914 RepID=UPI001F4F3E8F|nr:YihY/virulence factor BrkB family protein [Sphingomonas sp. LaA6.9]MCJ8159721.1 YihY/virulence factor BrkB family protein [Sphingomonas sp. LaA6.9]
MTPERLSSTAADRGRDAQSPGEMPRRAWRDILIRTWNESSADNIGLIAAGVAFYMFIALVPALAASLMIYGLVADPETFGQHLLSLFRLLPAQAATLIADQLIEARRTTSEVRGMGLAIALIFSIFGVANGATSIVASLNVIYDEDETRGYLRIALIALVIATGLVVLGVAATAAIGALAFLEGLMPAAPFFLLSGMRILFWTTAALCASGVIAVIYRYAPNRHTAKWRWITPGSLFATLSWLAVTLLFGVYVAKLSNYSATYGALSSVVVLLIWLYLSAYTLLMGAEFNAEIEHQTAQDSTTGKPNPMGRRGAYVADTIGKIP